MIDRDAMVVLRSAMIPRGSSMLGELRTEINYDYKVTSCPAITMTHSSKLPNDSREDTL
jgi:hypothetical protein